MRPFSMRPSLRGHKPSTEWSAGWLLSAWLLSGSVVLAEDQIREQRELAAGKINYVHMERSVPRPMQIHVLKMDLTSQDIAWEVVIAKDPDGDGPAEAELTSPFQLAKQNTNVLAVVNTNPWSALPEADGKQPEKPVWFPGRPVDISGLAASHGVMRSKPSSNYVSIWRDSRGQHDMGLLKETADSVQEGFGGFGQIVSKGKRIENQDSSLHPRTGVAFDKERQHMWFVVVDGRQPGYSEGMTTVELGDLFLDLGCWDAANLDGGGSSIMAIKQDQQGQREVLTTANRPSDRVLGGFSVARPLPMAVVIKSTDQSKPSDR